MAKSGIAYKITKPIKLKNKLKLFQAEVLSTSVDAVREATLLIHETAVKSIQDNSSGTPALRYGPKRTVNVSKPGDPPNTDTGRGAQSIKLDFKDEGLRGRVGTNLKYMRALEFGTNKMAPRPWLSAAIRTSAKDMKKIFQESFKKTVRKKSK